MLPPEEQDVLATRMLAEMAEMEFDRKIAATGDKLAVLARRAQVEYEAGLTEPLDPEKL